MLHLHCPYFPISRQLMIVYSLETTSRLKQELLQGITFQKIMQGVPCKSEVQSNKNATISPKEHMIRFAQFGAMRTI